MNNSIIEVINELFEAYGPQPFSEVFYEVRSQCAGLGGLHEAHDVTKTHLFYLVSLGAAIEQNDEFGVVYGHPRDFK